MTALASLIGVYCAECWGRGHRCQAQMWQEVEEGFLVSRRPLCLRCADGEPCHFVRVQSAELRRWPEESDLCVVPAVTAALRVAATMMGLESREDVPAHVRAAAEADLQTLAVSDVAKKYSLGVPTVSDWKSQLRRSSELRGAPVLAADLLQRRRQPSRVARGVRTAEKPETGPKPEGERTVSVEGRRCFRGWAKQEEKASRSLVLEADLLMVRTQLARHFGVSPEELGKARVGGDRREAHRRAVALCVAQQMTGASNAQVSRAFGVCASAVIFARHTLSANKNLQHLTEQLTVRFSEPGTVLSV